MELGPVLRLELITTARRGRYYAARVVYGLFLLFTVWAGFRNQVSMFGNREITGHDMALFAEGIFSSLAWLQWAAVLVVVPAMTAGVIADSHRRKTLRDLLSSGFSAWAIVFGKLSARLGHVAALVAVGIPVVALIGLFGGLDPWIVLDVYAGTASIAFAVGGVSILASTLAQRPREAIVAAYALELGWLILPPLFDGLLPHMNWPFPYLVPVNHFLVETNPFRVATEMSSYQYYPRNIAMMAWVKSMISQIHIMVAIMVGFQTILGLVCVGTAAFLIRKLRAGDRQGIPAFSWRDMLRSRKAKKRNPKAAAVVRPAIGEDPMLWKEWYANPRGGLAWLVSGPATLILGVLLFCYMYEIGKPAFLEFWSGQKPEFRSGREELNSFSRILSMWLMMVWLLTVVSAAAVEITSELEDDTWISLTSSLLTGREVIRGKILGALGGTRKLAFTILVVVAVGVLGGAVHPLGGFLTVTGMATFGIFAAALGVWCSLRMTNSTRALVTSVVLLILVNVTLILVNAAFRTFIDNWIDQEPPWMMLLSSPFLQFSSLLSYEEVSATFRGKPFRLSGSPEVFGSTILIMSVIGQALYGFTAVLLWTSSARAYDRIAGRAFRKRETVNHRAKQGAMT